MLVEVDKSTLATKRNAKGESRTQLSKKAGLANNAVFRMEREAHKVSYLRLQAVANALGCSVNELIRNNKDLKR